MNDLNTSRLIDLLLDEEEVNFVVGAGIGSPPIPLTSSILSLADRYAMGRSDGGNLARALVRATRQSNSPIQMYGEYRRLIAKWVSSAEFDVIAQQAVLEAYRPNDWRSSPLAHHSIWQRVSQSLGEKVESDLGAWRLSAGVETLGAILARLPDRLGNRVLTTNFDPLLEISIRSSGGQAASVPLRSDGTYEPPLAHEAVSVYHLHGFWRPVLDQGDEPLLHDPDGADDSDLIASIGELIRTDTICVLGTSDSAGVIARSLGAIANHRAIKVLWALHSSDGSRAAQLRDWLVSHVGRGIDVFPGVDAGDLLPRMAERLSVAIKPRGSRGQHRTRHPNWERVIVTWPKADPPRDADALLQQLERRFNWGLRRTDLGQVSVLFWPVKLQVRASVIHMVQAIAAGAVASRGAELEIALDDFGMSPPDRDATRSSFEADLLRWSRHTNPEIGVKVTSLSEFIASLPGADAKDLLRSKNPWTVATEFYGEHNPSLYHLLVAIKALPNLGPRELENQPYLVIQSLLRNNTNRLLTPLVMWPYLHEVLEQTSTQALLTLGGADESPFWEQWRQIYAHRFSQVGQLYNPYFPGLSHRSELVLWTNKEELLGNLHDMKGLDNWMEDGSYIPWLFQNAFLLPIWLNSEVPPELDGFPIDSWASFLAADAEQQPVLELLAERVSQLYLGTEVGGQPP